ncbi:hypothetical protein [uncultured Pseudomonas sp.]|uniref:hypothetical protein n=1 Tax=uncultured Pseudomonas sp. TaxID=114707 RepID=UPI0030D83177|tara:strand:- start:5 stop:748 length:744 start_codon:yes stop_codon:yes gene_type:complete
MDQLIKDAIADTMATIVPNNISRPWYLEYLFKYKFGDQLPRGKIFDRIRQIENPKKWIILRKDLYSDIINFAHHDKVSPFLVDQYTLLTLAKIYTLCDFRTSSIFEAINKVENGSCPGKENLIKHNVKFKKNGILSGYTHHHVPLLPNSYLSMLASTERNLDAIFRSISFPGGEFDLDINILEKEISSRGSDKGGRLTGHWLISKPINGKNIYLGIFPHGHKNNDDAWIRVQLHESERVFNLSGKRA